MPSPEPTATPDLAIPISRTSHRPSNLAFGLSFAALSAYITLVYATPGSLWIYAAAVGAILCALTACVLGAIADLACARHES